MEVWPVSGGIPLNSPESVLLYRSIKLHRWLNAAAGVSLPQRQRLHREQDEEST